MISLCWVLITMSCMRPSSFSSTRAEVVIVKETYIADPNKPDSLGTPPILKAAALGRLEMIKDLLAKGADPLFVDKKGKTALDKAILFEQFETVEFLEDLYSNINKNNLHYETKNSK
eukprot:TRINITY_DN2661_c0_g2_i5.p2 TRINITY_DN2661_c0_g2~~TRINITY_DN2661_c0_g2_i5.p2  ORF type:complete len:117 (-),score=13.13 TRINITY_DN2661_c0_g2_i5:288-638(-)